MNNGKKKETKSQYPTVIPYVMVHQVIEHRRPAENIPISRVYTYRRLTIHTLQFSE